RHLCQSVKPDFDFFSVCCGLLFFIFVHHHLSVSPCQVEDLEFDFSFIILSKRIRHFGVSSKRLLKVFNGKERAAPHIEQIAKFSMV
ncbi:hypothetical protein NPIL_286701, partial [Nephila pilipes]